jgi:DNA-binding transcriptional LysR family regulator
MWFRGRHIGSAFSALVYVRGEFALRRILLARSGVKLAAIDLNLLMVFDAVMQERSVTRAGNRLGLSQPAMSHALARLRHGLKDELFIRSPKGMVPTPRAEQLALPIRQALDALLQSLEPTAFDPSTATTHFRVAVDNYSAIVLVAALAERIVDAAPAVTLEFRPSGTLDIIDLLDRGELDLALGPWPDPGERFSRQSLLKDEFVAVMRKIHPAARSGALSLEKLAALPQLEISSVSYILDFFDEALARRKLRRRIALSAPFLSAVRILTTSDLVAIVRRRVAEEMARHNPLVIRGLPVPSPGLETAMIWPRRLDNQPAHRWLRGMATAATSELSAE